MEMQNTIKSEAAISGIALHTGVRIHLRMKPAPENTGIVFRRTDMPGAPEVRAYAPNVIDVRRATTIAAPSKAYVVTVEHIMAAFHAAGVDNAYVEMDNAEPPVADGSAGPYFKMIKEAGIQEKNGAVLDDRCPALCRKRGYLNGCPAVRHIQNLLHRGIWRDGA